MSLDSNRTVTELKRHLSVFLAQKRALGYKYVSIECSLNNFIRFIGAQVEPVEYLSKELILEYCKRRPKETNKSWRNRISDIRQFTKYLIMHEYEAYIPSLPRREPSTFTPYIFTHNEISRIFTAVDSIKPYKRYNCADVYPVLFRMLYGCGLRVSEALNLLVSDVDVSNGILTVRLGKYNKTRIVTMSESLTAICADLIKCIHANSNGNDYFFKNRDGSRRNKKSVSERFRELLWLSGIPYMGKGKGPRLHDVRHTYCCHALKQMADAGVDLYCSMPILSTYVGHASISATEKYIRLTEEFYPDIITRMHNTGTLVYPEVYYAEAN